MWKETERKQSGYVTVPVYCTVCPLGLVWLSLMLVIGCWNESLQPISVLSFLRVTFALPPGLSVMEMSPWQADISFISPAVLLWVSYPLLAQKLSTHPQPIFVLYCMQMRSFARCGEENLASWCLGMPDPPCLIGRPAPVGSILPKSQPETGITLYSEMTYKLQQKLVNHPLLNLQIWSNRSKIQYSFGILELFLTNPWACSSC